MFFAYLGWALAFALATAPPPAEPAALEVTARQLETMLIAPCCWQQPVSEHQSQASDEVKQQIRVLLSSGKTKQEVLDAFVQQYGKRILAQPRAEGFGLLLYVGPVLAFGLGSAGLIVLVRRLARKGGDPAPPPPSIDQQYADRLDEELRDLN
jgi:cytochrome c-type biogenesis protein CcmH